MASYDNQLCINIVFCDEKNNNILIAAQAQTIHIQRHDHIHPPILALSLSLSLSLSRCFSRPVLRATYASALATRSMEGIGGLIAVYTHTHINTHAQAHLYALAVAHATRTRTRIGIRTLTRARTQIDAQRRSWLCTLFLRIYSI